MTIDSARIYLENGTDLQLCIDCGVYHVNCEVKPLHLWVILWASDYDPEDFDQRIYNLIHGREDYTLEVDDGVGLEVLRYEHSA